MSRRVRSGSACNELQMRVAHASRHAQSRFARESPFRKRESACRIEHNKFRGSFAEQSRAPPGGGPGPMLALGPAVCRAEADQLGKELWNLSRTAREYQTNPSAYPGALTAPLGGCSGPTRRTSETPAASSLLHARYRQAFCDRHHLPCVTQLTGAKGPSVPS